MSAGTLLLGSSLSVESYNVPADVSLLTISPVRTVAGMRTDARFRTSGFEYR